MQVLILVLVEDGLGAAAVAAEYKAKDGSLNPCFSGGWSRSNNEEALAAYFMGCLNPCFSGGWSRRYTENDC